MFTSRRYEDNGDAVNNLVVISQKTDKNSITGYGGPDKFLNEFSYLLGKQVFAGERQTPRDRNCCYATACTDHAASAAGMTLVTTKPAHATLPDMADS